MSKFFEIEKKLGLKKFIQGTLGVLYFVPLFVGKKRVLVRYFDPKYGKGFAQKYADIIHKCSELLLNNNEIANMAHIELPIEIGEDYVTRKHHIYTTSTNRYEDEHNPPEIPEGLVECRSEIKRFLDTLSDKDNEGILRNILMRSVIKPYSKTFFDDIELKFVVVEPKILPDEVYNWKKVTKNQVPKA